jgi:hypothetical protein
MARTRDATLRLAAFGSLGLSLLVLPSFASTAQAQEHRHHPPEDMPIHERFYSTWYMPDQPTKSCCNKADCYPTDVKYIEGQTYARRREDGKWLPIPASKVERNRDNPDGRNHLCAPPPQTYGDGDVVFCFALGGGA